MLTNILKREEIREGILRDFIWSSEMMGTTARGSGGGDLANTAPTYESSESEAESCPDPFWATVQTKSFQLFVKIHVFIIPPLS